MKTKFSFILFLFGLFLSACSNGQTANLISATDFAKKIKQSSNAVILDVRTPREFQEGHIKNAVNVDWNGANFDAETQKIDKSTPVFVYCLSGGRSAAASENLRTKGFKTIIELEGGMMKWRMNNLPETK